MNSAKRCDVRKRLTDAALNDMGNRRIGGFKRHRNSLAVRLRPGSPQPWERQANESPQAYRAFSTYRDQDPALRTAVEAARSTGISVQLAHRWSRRHSWIERAAAFDAYLDSLRLERGIEARLAMDKRHAEVACMMIEKLRRRVASLKVSSLSPGEAARWLKIAAEVERMARGLDVDSEPITVSGQSQPVEVKVILERIGDPTGARNVIELGQAASPEGSAGQTGA